MSKQSWGLFPHTTSEVITYNWLPKSLPKNNPILPYGLGRSYGDSCLNDQGTLLVTDRLNRYISFDPLTGILEAECGTSLEQILLDFVPRGWFLPVTPGTKFVTLGGAIANDVHGKNHHAVGNFGHHVLSLRLLRSDQQVYHCHHQENADLFFATIGGLGLTGLILTAKIQLTPIQSSYIHQDIIAFDNVDDFYELSKSSMNQYKYNVAWIDCFSNSNKQNRGLFYRGNFSTDGRLDTHQAKSLLQVPIYFPNQALNSFTIKGFNELYYQVNRLKKSNLAHYNPFFYPLDAIHHWNRIYGRQGFYQYQCVIPWQNKQAIHSLLKEITQAQMGSFLAVLKVFGEKKSLGMMSFPEPGITLALDFPVNQESTKLLEKLDLITIEAQGKVYIAKDARMSKNSFHHFYPRFNEFQKMMDPQFSSSFIRRVT